MSGGTRDSAAAGLTRFSLERNIGWVIEGAQGTTNTNTLITRKILLLIRTIPIKI